MLMQTKACTVCQCLQDIHGEMLDLGKNIKEIVAGVNL